MRTRTNLALAEPQRQPRSQRARSTARPPWKNESAFVVAVLDEARERIIESDWPEDWQRLFTEPGVETVWTNDNRARARAEAALRARRAVQESLTLRREALAVDPLPAGYGAVERHTTAGLEAALLFLDLEHADASVRDGRRARLARTMCLWAWELDRELSAPEMALMSIRAGWAQEEHHGFKGKTVAQAIDAETDAMRQARKRHSLPKRMLHDLFPHPTKG